MVTDIYDRNEIEATHGAFTNRLIYIASNKLFTPSDLAKSRSSEIGLYNIRIALKCDSHIGKDAAKVPPLLELLEALFWNRSPDSWNATEKFHRLCVDTHVSCQPQG